MKNTSLTYEQARQKVKEIGFQTVKEYRESYKKYGLPSNPPVLYKGKGWLSWDVYLGKRDSDYPDYKEAKRIVWENGIRSMKQYKNLYKEHGLPSHPEMVYKDKGWIDYKSFFGKDSIPFLSYEEAQKLVQEKGITGEVQYKSSYKGLRLPSHPEMVYKDSGWISWDIFLGKTHKLTSEEKWVLILEKLSIAPDLLKEDAPLQIIYLLASKLDKRIAKEIEELLNTSSHEDRVKWVKNQLDRVKEGASVKPETSIETPPYETPVVESEDEEWDTGEGYENDSALDDEEPDEMSVLDPKEEEAPSELAVMESAIEVLKNSSNPLSEEDTEQIRIWMENYYHNAVNRELMKEEEVD